MKLFTSPCGHRFGFESKKKVFKSSWICPTQKLACFWLVNFYPSFHTFPSCRVAWGRWSQTSHSRNRGRKGIMFCTTCRFAKVQGLYFLPALKIQQITCPYHLVSLNLIRFRCFSHPVALYTSYCIFSSGRRTKASVRKGPNWKRCATMSSSRRGPSQHLSCWRELWPSSQSRLNKWCPLIPKC